MCSLVMLSFAHLTHMKNILPFTMCDGDGDGVDGDVTVDDCSQN